ncbi:alpha/beta hydrolase [Arcobacter sp. YIC-80]|uniref:alpha/beta hydrolase n=1 Tax=Arcobacter sp. YIC-80 TaxID=3376683 RepID=UPI00384DD1DD
MFGGVYLYFFQRTFIYFPTKKIEHNSFEETFNIDKEKIKVIVINKGNKKAILYFPGRSENVANNIENYRKNFPNNTIYLVNYRSYGGSSGIATEKNLYKDAKYIFEKISKRHQSIDVIGRSLGTGIATHLASNSKIRKLILVTPYDSILNMARDKYPFYPIKYILKDQYNSINRVKKIVYPTLIFLASEDKTVKHKYSKNLIKEFKPSLLTVKTIANTNHKNIVDKIQYFKNLKEFLK